MQTIIIKSINNEYSILSKYTYNTLKHDFIELNKIDIDEIIYIHISMKQKYVFKLY